MYSAWLVLIVPDDFLLKTSMGLVLDLIYRGRRALLRSPAGACLAKKNTSAADWKDKHICTSECVYVHMDAIRMLAASAESEMSRAAFSACLSWNRFSRGKCIK